MCRYRIRRSDIERNDGARFLIKFSGSPASLIISTFPELSLLPWLFDKPPHGYLNVSENRVKYIKWLVQKVGVSGPQELTTNHFRENRGMAFLARYNMSPKSAIESLSSTEMAPVSKVTHAVRRRRQVPSRNHWVQLFESIKVFPKF